MTDTTRETTVSTAEADILVAAVEALRERVAELESALLELNPEENLKAYGDALDRAEAAEARVATLEEALEWYRSADERDVEGGVLESIFECPAAKVLAACYTKETKQ